MSENKRDDIMIPIQACNLIIRDTGKRVSKSFILGYNELEEIGRILV